MSLENLKKSFLSSAAILDGQEAQDFMNARVFLSPVIKMQKLLLQMMGLYCPESLEEKFHESLQVKDPILTSDGAVILNFTLHDLSSMSEHDSYRIFKTLRDFSEHLVEFEGDEEYIVYSDNFNDDLYGADLSKEELLELQAEELDAETASLELCVPNENKLRDLLVNFTTFYFDQSDDENKKAPLSPAMSHLINKVGHSIYEIDQSLSMLNNKVSQMHPQNAFPPSVH